MNARYYIKHEKEIVKCELCPHTCLINNGNYGICGVRYNKNGTLISENYGIISSMGFDPIEKKPLYHFYPGSDILSIGSLGCNLQCDFCQNWQISQTKLDHFGRGCKVIDPDEIINIACSKDHNIGIAYTYNEPAVFIEFVLDTAIKARKKGLKNIMVSNGFINLKPLKDLNMYIDAYSIDLKAFNESFFNKYTKSRLEPVKEAIKNIVDEKKHLEITNLVIPTLNDDVKIFKDMVKWIEEEAGKETVLHISRYYPTYKLSIEPTSVEKMLELYQIAKEHLDYVFLGNVSLEGKNNTYCPNCKELLIKRNGYNTSIKSVQKDGSCGNCGLHVFNHI